MTNRRYDAQAALQILSKRSRIQEAREDTTAILLCKLTQIVQENDRPLLQLMDEIAHDPRRAEQVIHSLIGLVVQYSEKSAGFLPLCEYLSSSIAHDSPMPGMAESDRRWVT
jgi:hypothetical protein